MNVLIQKTDDRKAFVRRAFDELDLAECLRGSRRVLIKPNIVSHERYPTTTHPAVVEACLEYLTGRGLRLAVGDGPAVDAGKSAQILERHPLKEVCRRFGVPLIDVLERKMVRRKPRGMTLELSEAAFEYDFILSLPVLKSHAICALTGALKNQFGFLSRKERVKLHTVKNIHKGIAALNLIVTPGFFVVDAVETLTRANEVRHGGRKASLGYMLAGTDPVSLDVAGLEILQTVEPRLAGKTADDIPHLRYAIEIGVGTS